VACHRLGDNRLVPVSPSRWAYRLTVTTVIQNATIVTGNFGRTILYDHALAVRDDRIDAIGWPPIKARKSWMGGEKPSFRA